MHCHCNQREAGECIAIGACPQQLKGPSTAEATPKAVCNAGLCYALLSLLALNFLKALLSAKWLRNSQWVGSPSVDAAAAQAANLVQHLASWHDALLASSNPTLTSQVHSKLVTTTPLVPSNNATIFRVCLCRCTARCCQDRACHLRRHHYELDVTVWYSLHPRSP